MIRGPHQFMERANRLVPSAHTKIAAFRENLANTHKTNALMTLESWEKFLSFAAWMNKDADACVCTAGLTWMYSKAVYQFPETVTAMLVNTDLPIHIPIQAIADRIPEICLYIALPETLNREFTGFFVQQFWCETFSRYRIVITYIAPKKCQWLFLDEESYAEACKEPKTGTAVFSFSINSILLISRQDPKPLNPNKKDSPSKTQNQEKHIHPAKKIKTITIGTEIAAKMTWPKGKQSEKLLTPHMRRGHWHHYWTGPKTGPRELKLNWVYPCFVSGRSEDNAD